MNMKRKRQLLMVMLCAFSMLANSAAVVAQSVAQTVAQSKDKQQDPKSNTRQAPEAQGDILLIAEPAQEPTFNIAVGGPGPERMAFVPGRQVEFIHNEFSFDNKLVKDAPYSAD